MLKKLLIWEWSTRLCLLHDELETTAYEWAQEILAKSPTSIKMLKFAMNLTDDGMVGQND